MSVLEYEDTGSYTKYEGPLSWVNLGTKAEGFTSVAINYVFTNISM